MSLCKIQRREVAQAGGELRVAISKNRFIQADGPIQQWFGLLIFTLRVMDSGQFRERPGKPGILFFEGFRFLERGGVLFLGLFEASLLEEKITTVHVPVPRSLRVLASREADCPDQASGHQSSPPTIQHVVTFFRIGKNFSYRLASSDLRDEKKDKRRWIPAFAGMTICNGVIHFHIKTRESKVSSPIVKRETASCQLKNVDGSGYLKTGRVDPSVVW